MSLLDDFERVRRERPCPICSHGDWCLIAREGGDDPVSAICARIESPRRWGDAGWFHRLRDRERDSYPRTRTVTVTKSRDFGVQAARYVARMPARILAALSSSLGVSAASLGDMEVGWTGRAYTFPMRDAEGRTVGIRLRYPGGRKSAVRGGREGLFIPTRTAAGLLLVIAEGPTDTAALLDLGFRVVGRPSCRGGRRLCVDYARQSRIRCAVVVADNDQPGLAGAIDLAKALIVACTDVRVVHPPERAGDVRDWVRQGCVAGDVEQVVAQAEPIKPVFTVTVRP